MILLCGSPNSGKTWMTNVVFRGRSPLDLVAERRELNVVTFNLAWEEPQGRVSSLPLEGGNEEEEDEEEDWNVEFQGVLGEATSGMSKAEYVKRRRMLHVFPKGLRVVDYPGGDLDALWFENLGFPNEPEAWRQVAALVYVLDAQEEVRPKAMHSILSRAKACNPKMSLFVFINKVDGDPFGSEDTRVEVRHLFQRQVSRDFSDGDLLDDMSFHLTSVYNHSCKEAWSLVVQKLIKHQSVVVELLDGLIEACDMEKAFLFDSRTKLFTATDHNPVDHQTLALCSDLIDAVVDVEDVYSPASQHGAQAPDDTCATVRLSHDMMVFARRVGAKLVLVCVLRKEAFAPPKPVVAMHNVELFERALMELYSGS